MRKTVHIQILERRSVIGLLNKVKNKAFHPIDLRMELCIQENGSTVRETEWESRNGQMAQSTSVNGSRVLWKEKAK